MTNEQSTNENSVNNHIKNICVFCGSGSGNNPAFTKTASELGSFLAVNNINLIYGGGDFGLMGTLARSSMQHNGKVTGIIPEFLMRYQQGDFSPTELLVTSDMHSRKAKMYQLADAFIALPGGIGTLEELVETMTWSQLGTHNKPIFLFNAENFWAPLLSLLDAMRDEAFIRKGLEVNFKVIESVSELEQQIRDFNSQNNSQDKNENNQAQNLDRL